MYMNFGSLPISPTQDLVLKKIMNFLNDFMERPHAYTSAPKWLFNLNPNGILTEAQWDIVDIFSQDRKDRPTLMDLVEQQGKRSTSSITKPRDMARKKIIEAILTLTYVLQDENILKNFIGELLNNVVEED